MKNKIYFLLVLFLLSCKPTEEIYISYVCDGDTVIGKDGERYRLAEVDAPESLQTFGEESREFTKRHVLNKTIRIKIVSKDKYDRYICQVYVNGLWFNKMIVDSGYAHWYSHYSTSTVLQKAEERAKSKKIGLWSKPNQTPFSWRLTHKQ
jgi:micrococcal nuclease